MAKMWQQTWVLNSYPMIYSLVQLIHYSNILYTFKKDKKVCTALKYIEQLLNIGSAVTGSVWISAFSLLVGIPIGIVNSSVGLKNYEISPVVK